MKIGFSIEPAQEAPTLTLPIPEPSKPVRSLVQVRFEGDGRLLTYYNDLFDLAHTGNSRKNHDQVQNQSLQLRTRNIDGKDRNPRFI